MQQILISPMLISKMKKRAKRLQRKTGRPHHELLDELAQKAGLPNWHHLLFAYRTTLALENQFGDSLVVMIDSPVCWGLIGTDFEDANEFVGFRIDEIVHWLRNASDDCINEPEADLRESIEFNYSFLRYTSSLQLPCEADLLGWLWQRILPHSAFLPDLVWLRGKLIDPNVLSRLQENGPER